jgi:hypothetical protein
MKRIGLLLIPTIIGIGTSGCFNDKESNLYGQVCDSSAVTYNGTIRPILTTSCSYGGCHDGKSYNGGGIDLTSHAGVLAKVQDNSLLPAIQHQSGYSAMPKDNGKLPDCQISQIRTWVLIGAPNN